MHTDKNRGVLERKTDAEIALAIHYLDPEFHSEENNKGEGIVLGLFVSAVTWLIGAVTYICLYMRTL